MSEELKPLAEIATLLPAVRGRKSPHRSTLYRWATSGLKSRSGERIRLESEFVGGTICSTLEAVRRLGKRKCDLDWQPISTVSEREKKEMESRAEAAIQRLRTR